MRNWSPALFQAFQWGWNTEVLFHCVISRDTEESLASWQTPSGCAAAGTDTILAEEGHWNRRIWCKNNRWGVGTAQRTGSKHAGEGPCASCVYFFQWRERFADFQKLSAPLPRAEKRTDSRDHFSAGRALAPFSLSLQNDPNLQLSGTSFWQPKLFWKRINNTF